MLMAKGRQRRQKVDKDGKRQIKRNNQSNGIIDDNKIDQMRA